MDRILPRLLSIPIACAFILLGVAAYSQSQYLIQHYTNENGLPANGIKGIELDKKTGFLWIGTQAGLVRFDGKSFKSFDSAKNAVAASRIIAVSRDRAGTIYSVDDNFSIYRIVNNRPQWLMTDTIFMNLSLTRGRNYKTKTAKQVAETFRHHQPSSFLPYFIVFNDESGDSSSFTFTYRGHTYHYSAANDTLLHLSNDLTEVLKLEGRLYFARENLDLLEYNDSLMQLVSVRVTNMPAWDKQGEKPKYIWRTGMKEPLLVFKQSIWKLQRTGNEIQLQALCQSCYPPDAHINAVQVWEEQGIIFLSSIVKGLYVVRSPFLRSISTDTVNVKYIGRAEYAHAEIIPNTISTFSGYSFSLDGKLLPRKTTREFSPYTMYRDRQGDYWFHVRDTIFHYHPQTGRYNKITMNDGVVKLLFAETRNQLYVVSDITIAAINGNQHQLLYKLPSSANNLKNSLNPDAVIEWKPGVLAIAAEKLVLFDTQKRTTLDTIAIPGLTVKVRALLKHLDYLLIGTYGQGFYIYRNGVTKKMPLDKNGYLSYAHCFMPDDAGFCWISTNHGLFKASMNSLVAAYESNNNEVYYHYFGKEDGIANTEFNGGCQPCALKLSNGMYSFPGMGGLVVLDPRQQHRPPPSGQILIDEVLADSISCRPGDSLLYELPHDLRNLRFRLAMSQFGNTENIYFSYKLEPYNKEWESHDIVQNNVLQFGGLKPGSYTLHLRVRNGFGPDQFSTAMVSFFIQKPWYQAWWFYLLCVLAFFAITWGLVKWRTARIIQRKEELQQLVTVQTKNIAEQSKQLESQLHQLQNQQIKLEENNRIKARLITIITHDMISPLKFMAFNAEKLRDAFASTDPSYRVAESIVAVTHELESLSVNMLNWIRFHHQAYEMKAELFDLHKLVNESVEIASILAREK
ncbi:MAG TPA: triple tyrosine motif-containing protein, partial [Chitinophagaceae bacterium]|nr:triple tyrosine motif-containing protein [Chitinophagaceae bacterium]